MWYIREVDKPCISMIAAIGKNRELGLHNELLWRIPDDLKRFKKLTLGHPVIMGRKTFESIGKPLPRRTNIVLSTNQNVKHEGIFIVHSSRDALAAAKKSPGNEEIFIIGGAKIYEEFFTQVERLYLTIIEATKDADSFFPRYEEVFTKKVSEGVREWSGLTYRWVTLEK